MQKQLSKLMFLSLIIVVVSLSLAGYSNSKNNISLYESNIISYKTVANKSTGSSSFKAIKEASREFYNLAKQVVNYIPPGPLLSENVQMDKLN